MIAFNEINSIWKVRCILIRTVYNWIKCILHILTDMHLYHLKLWYMIYVLLCLTRRLSFGFTTLCVENKAIECPKIWLHAFLVCVCVVCSSNRCNSAYRKVFLFLSSLHLDILLARERESWTGERRQWKMWEIEREKREALTYFSEVGYLRSSLSTEYTEYDYCFFLLSLGIFSICVSVNLK